MVAVEIVAERLEHVPADALVIPVDGALCRLGGAAAAAIRAALASTEDAADELDYVEDQLARLRPLAHPSARAIDGVARWNQLILVAAYPHDVDGATFAPDACARMVRAAVPSAIAAADASSVALALIGTQYRMPADVAVRALVSVPDPELHRLTVAAARRVGLVS